MVPKPVQVHTLHYLAQLQVENLERPHRAGDIPHVDIVLLFHSRLHGEKNVGSLNVSKMTLCSTHNMVFIEKLLLRANMKEL